MDPRVWHGFGLVRGAPGSARDRSFRRRRRAGLGGPRHPRPAERTSEGRGDRQRATAAVETRLARAFWTARTPKRGPGSDVVGDGFGFAARGSRAPVGGTRRTGGPGSDPACEAGPPGAAPRFVCQEAALRPAQAAAGWCQGLACTPIRTVLARRQGAHCPARTTADLRIEPWRLFYFGGRYSGVGRGGADDPLAQNRRHPIGMSEPDVPPGQHGAKTAKISLPDSNLGNTPPPPRQMDFGHFLESNDFNGLDNFGAPRWGSTRADSRFQRTRVGL